MYSFHLKFNISLIKKSFTFPLVPEISNSQFFFSSSVTPLFFWSPNGKNFEAFMIFFFQTCFKPTSSKYQPCDLEQIRQPDNQFGYQLTHIK